MIFSLKQVQRSTILVDMSNFSSYGSPIGGADRFDLSESAENVSGQ